MRKLISDANKNLVLLKLDPSASPLWEKNVVMSDDPNFLDIVEMNINSFGQLNLSLHFTGTCSVMGQSYFSRGEKDALLMALSSNHGEHLWVEQIGGQGDELISNQFFNESGVFGISLTTAGFNFVNDEVQVLRKMKSFSFISGPFLKSLKSLQPIISTLRLRTTFCMK